MRSMSSEAVSYTHLDVYKRQVYGKVEDLAARAKAAQKDKIVIYVR